MKQTLLLFIAAVCGFFEAEAQDLIVKTDATQVEAKVTEITPEAVRYKRFSNPDGPTYVLPVGAIHYIQYANGEKEYFTVPQAPAAPLPPAPLPPAPPVPGTPGASAPAVPAAPPAPAAATAAPAQQAPAVEYIRKEYAVGDYYERDGIRGVVCMVTEDRAHGLILSLDEIYLPWSVFRKGDLRRTGIADRTDGEANMRSVEEYIVANGLTWDDFPAFKWCRDKGEGWYLPSIDELLTIGHNYNGGSRIHNNRQARNRFNDALKDNGGKRMDRLVYYFSSTETDEKSAYTTHTGIEPPYVIEIPKHNKFLVRAVHKF